MRQHVQMRLRSAALILVVVLAPLLGAAPAASGATRSADGIIHWAGYNTPVAVGSDTPVVFDVGNDGPTRAAGLRLRVHFPPNFSYVSSDAACTLWHSSLLCRLGDFRTGREEQVTIWLRAVSTGTAKIKGTLTAATPDPNVVNNEIHFFVEIS
jgi:hypothetical protein